MLMSVSLPLSGHFPGLAVGEGGGREVAGVGVHPHRLGRVPPELLERVEVAGDEILAEDPLEVDRVRPPTPSCRTPPCDRMSTSGSLAVQGKPHGLVGMISASKASIEDCLSACLAPRDRFAVG